ncbi:MAG: methyltetrahydrofolate--corrinoid methyltransferase [Chloroflexi bacterium RBG_19FT_COMBO_55_16]|nr:MAG: methyltetrahydrofolate--corrinoid methyltransferase [Chloroflexi bacterium RBG_19FT_COMBO_55_16]
METIITSPKRVVKIGPEHPFVIIGERINPTGRKRLAAEMAVWDFERVRADAIAQVAAGAHMLDVNAGIPLADEPAILAEAVRVVQSVVDVPLSIDSSIVAALEAGLAAYQGKPLVNSVTGEDERLEVVLPLVKQYGAAVIGITNDESGISEDPHQRFVIAKKIITRAESFGIPREDVLIDPLAMPIGAVRSAGTSVFTIVRRVREELGCNTICGASNISFGLPDRPTLNATFLAMAIAAGMTCAITNPLEGSLRKTMLAADVFMGHDENCLAWLRAQRAESRGEDGSDSRRRRRMRTED